MKKAQTATEYIILIAIVIVIALIVVGILGGIPGIGGSSSKAVDQAALASRPLGISEISLGSIGAVVTVRNNMPSAIILESLSFADSGVEFTPLLPIRLGIGESRQIISSSDVSFNQERRTLIQFLFHILMLPQMQCMIIIQKIIRLKFL